MRLSELSILTAWFSLGGGDLRGKRGKAFWRGGDGDNISLNTERQTWYDFREGQGGGVLALVETALSCSRAEALVWLAATCGLDHCRQTSAEDRRRSARARVEAPALARRLADFARGLQLTATQRGARLLRQSTAADIAARWQQLDLQRRDHLEHLGRADYQDAEHIVSGVVAMLATTQAHKEAA